jgi:hypothetical protein
MISLEECEAMIDELRIESVVMGKCIYNPAIA